MTKENALDLLQEWISKDPTQRRVKRMSKLVGSYIVELQSSSGSFMSHTQLTLDSAVRTAIMTASMSGEP